MPRKNADDLSSQRDSVTNGLGQGRDFWRSLEELYGSDEFQRYLEREFPDGAARWSGANRREFLTLMGASLALAGLTGCRSQPLEEIVPYVEQPELIVPGQPLYYATAMTTGGVATGLLVESHMGRPTKIEGNPRHPAVPDSVGDLRTPAAPGASDIFAQAELLTLYDPDRSQTVTGAGQISTWDALLAVLRPKLEEQKSVAGRGIRLLTETVTSPTLAAQVELLLRTYPQAKWHQYEPVHRDNELEGLRLAFGRFASARYDLRRADVILALDSDFLTVGPAHLLHARAVADGRDVGEGDATEMNRLYVVESTPTLTGAAADHRLALRADQIEAFALSLAVRLGVESGVASPSGLPEGVGRWLDAVADDLRNYRRGDGTGAGLVLAGPQSSPVVHALAQAMNSVLGNVGKTVSYTEPVEAEPVMQVDSLRELVTDMEAGDVELLVVLGGNPVYTAPADLPLAEAMEKVPLRVRLGTYEDETSARCHWHVPEAHFLETWSDARAFDGTVSIVQPLIAPLYNGKSTHELLAALLGEPGRSSYDIVKEYWRGRFDMTDDFEALWQTALHDGFVRGTELPTIDMAVGSLGDLSPTERTDATDDGSSDRVVVEFRPDPTVWDGRYANNGWLQELPKPFSKLTWDNAALIGPGRAGELGLRNGDVARIEHEGRAIEMPIWILPGQRDDTVTLHLGYGRARAGRVGTGVGVDVNALRSARSPWRLFGARIEPTGRRRSLATTQHHHLMEGRDLVRTGTVDQLREDPDHPSFMASRHHGEPTSLFSEHPYEGYKWGMTIDLNRCIGCNACVTACQAENNIPVVGKEQVALGREMHWIRVDSYYEGEASRPRVVHQPVPCMHCENAPCELVCPVAATVHGDEGLNEMVYNRCVGTRYCSNNCPYKVRRFNFLQYSDLETPSLKPMRNPDVTVRNRGVMEKCTYCVQRISAARIDAEKQGRSILDGEVITACQAACPSRAIEFGDLNDSSSRIAGRAKSPLNYSLLSELNTRPRTTYLATLRNPNPALETSDTKERT